MPDLGNTVRWIDFEPDLLGNRSDPRPFYFRLHGSLSKVQLDALEDALAARSTVPPLPKEPPPSDEEKAAHNEATRVALVKKYAVALEPYVKFGDEPLAFDGMAVKTLHEYLDHVSKHLAGLPTFFEPYNALYDVNVLGGSSSFSSGRRSGGFTSTASRRSVGAGRTAAR